MRKRLLIGLLSAGLVAAMLPGVASADRNNRPFGTPGGDAACVGQWHGFLAQNGGGLGNYVSAVEPPQKGVKAMSIYDAICSFL